MPDEIKDGGPAFPRTGFELSRHDNSPADCDPQPGMTLRDWLAGQALAGICANPREDYSGTTRNEKADEAYRQADAMLASKEAKL